MRIEIPFTVLLIGTTIVAFGLMVTVPAESFLNNMYALDSAVTFATSSFL